MTRSSSKILCSRRGYPESRNKYSLTKYTSWNRVHQVFTVSIAFPGQVTLVSVTRVVLSGVPSAWKTGPSLV